METQLRYEQNLRFGRELAEKLAREAEKIAATFEYLARLHEEVAVTEGHPMAGLAAARASKEREMADTERAASDWFRSIAAGSLQKRTK